MRSHEAELQVEIRPLEPVQKGNQPYIPTHSWDLVKHIALHVNLKHMDQNLKHMFGRWERLILFFRNSVHTPIPQNQQWPSLCFFGISLEEFNAQKGTTQNPAWRLCHVFHFCDANTTGNRLILFSLTWKAQTRNPRFGFF